MLRINLKRSNIALLAIAFCSVGILSAPSTASASLVSVELSADLANSSGSAHGGSLPNTLNDGFAYDPNNPESPLPAQSYSGSNAFHGAGGNPTVFYNLEEITIEEGQQFYFDFYGRSNCCQGRDDNYDVALLTGGALGAVVAEVLGNNNPNDANDHLRTDFSSLLTAGDQFDTIRIVGNNGNFTIQEVRAAVTENAVPEPATATLALLGLGGLMMRRKRTA
jgi:hypothetical protein